MPSDHPFHQLFETFGKLPEAHAENVNREAKERLKEHLAASLEEPGRCMLLKAPRAGHGKTHLLTRLQHELGGTHEFIPLHATGGSRIDAVTVLDDTLRRLVRPLPAAGGLTVLDLVARRLFSSSLQPLVRSGEVPCQDREGALNALRTRPIETFDFHHPSAVTAHWARENFELLGPRLALELSQRNGLALREVSFWVEAMFRFAATPIDNPGRVRALSVSVFDDPTAESAAHERLVALLGLLSSLMRIVLIADELEGFSSDETAALRFASFLGALRQSVERLEVVVSINQDVWESAFIPRLSGGLADRLSEVVVELEPLDREAKIAILESRSAGEGEKLLAEMDSDSVPSHARGLIRQAAKTCENRKRADSEKGPVLETAKPETAPPARQDQAEPAPSGTSMPDFSASAADSRDPEEIHDETPVRAFGGQPPAVESGFSAQGAPEPAVPEQPQPASWPAPEVSQSDFSKEPEPTAIETKPQPTGAADFSTLPPRQEPEEQSPPLSHPPIEPAPVPNDPSGAFRTVPPEAPNDRSKKEDATEASTSRVDDLLKQFRERYGKS